MHFAKSKLLNPNTFKHALTDATQLPVAPFKKAIKNALSELKTHQLEGASSSSLVKNYTWMIDQLVIIIWDHHVKAQKQAVSLELVAVGGYGRGELHPFSDVDLLILLEKDQYETVKDLIESFLRFLWDIGLDIGHSVRSIKDCIKEARSDITVMTNLLEARHLAGNDALFQILDQKIRMTRNWSADKFYQAKYDEQEKRHARYQDTAYSLEPNLKESPGGLRDLQTILWIYNRHYGVKTFREMNEQGLLDDDEYRILIRARNILWRMRSGLHLITNRHEDRLLFDTQRLLAAEFGYQDSKTHLAVEQLMKRFYRTAKQVIYLNEVLLASYRINNNKRASISVGKSIDDHFALKNKMIAQRNDDVFKQEPKAMLRLFNVMQQHNITSIHPDTIRAIRANLGLINNQFRAEADSKNLFLKLFKHDGTTLTNVLARNFRLSI